MSIWTDKQFYTSKIEKVKPKDGASFELTVCDGWQLWVENDKGLPIPSVGQTVRMYGKGLHMSVRGIAVDDTVYRYQTEAQESAEWATREADLEARNA